MADGLLQVTHDPHQSLTGKLSDILGKDGDTKKKLIGIYREILTLFNTDPDEKLEEEMSAHYGNYKTLLETYANDLIREERPIVVTGETGAGKSTVLNLLLGFNVLPTSTLPCTGAICRLRNSKTKKADIIDFHEKIVRTIEMEDNDENKFTEDLSGCINPEVQREEHQIKYVDIYWPIPFLTKNVFIVDTPGIGESDEMTERLVGYLPNAIALIYIIDPTHGGGITKDRIVPLFKAIRGQDNDGMRQAFDPSCAMFLCNKWDMVGKHEENKVLGFVRNKLEISWPNIQEKQIYRISAKKTRERLTVHQRLPEEFVELRRNIEELIEMSLCAKLRQHKTWLSRFLNILHMTLTSHLKNNTLSECQRRKQVSRGNSLLKKLQDCREISKNKLREEADDECERLAKAIHNHLADKNNREDMFPWHKVRLPSKGGALDKIKKDADEIIQNLVSEEIHKCLRKYGGQDTLNKLMETVRKEMESIRKTRYALEQLLQNPEEMDDDDFVIIDNINFPEIITKTEFPKAGIAVIAMAFPLWFPLALVGGVLLVPVAVASVIKDTVQVAKYKNNKTKYMTEWANIYLNAYTEDSLCVWLKDNIFETFNQNLNELFDKELPQTIYGCKILLDNLENEVQSEESTIERYQLKLDKCKQILEKLQALSSTSTSW